MPTIRSDNSDKSFLLAEKVKKIVRNHLKAQGSSGKIDIVIENGYIRYLLFLDKGLTELQQHELRELLKPYFDTVQQKKKL